MNTFPLVAPLSSFLRDHGFDYLEFRLWIGLWSGLFCLLLVATDASFLVQYFTRFTEEGFSALISFIFIYDAFKKMIKLGHHNPIHAYYDPELVTQYDCRCTPGVLLAGEHFHLEICIYYIFFSQQEEACFVHNILARVSNQSRFCLIQIQDSLIIYCIISTSVLFPAQNL